ncbi:hypothetical protein hairong_128 [Pseudomonas phage hairong]|nr:hypothetical protein hairong_128 [Pseudomonas phage hairong]
MMTVAQQADKLIQLATLIRTSAKHAEEPNPKLAQAIQILAQVGSTQMGRS